MNPIVLPFDSSKFPPLTNAEFETLKSILTKGDYTKHVSLSMHNEVQKSTHRVLPLTTLSKIRMELLTVRAMKASQVFPKVAQQVISRYNAGENIYDISSSLDQPAMACFRAVLKSQGLSETAVKQGTKGSEKVLKTPRDVAQQKIAADHDHATTNHVDNDLSTSMQFEKQLQHYLDSNSIGYQTQHELTKPGSLTPDFLLTHEIQIGTHRVCWIDAKDFVGGVTDFMTKKTKSQAKKYLEAFGPGAMVYARGVTEKHVRDLASDCLVLDFRWLEDASRKRQCLIAEEGEEEASWTTILALLASGKLHEKVSKDHVRKVNRMLNAMDELPLQEKELNKIRFALLTESMKHVKIDQEWLQTRYAQNPNVFVLSEELGCNAHTVFLRLFSVEEKKDLYAEVLQKDWLAAATPAIVDKASFANTVAAFLTDLKLEFSKLEGHGFLLSQGMELTIGGQRVEWLLVSDSLGGMKDEVNAEVEDLARFWQKEMGTQGAVVYSLGFLPGHKVEGLVMVDYRILQVA